MHMESKRIISFLINAEPHNGRGGLASVSFWPLGTYADKIPAPGLHYCNKRRLNTLVSFFSATLIVKHQYWFFPMGKGRLST